MGYATGETDKRVRERIGKRLKHQCFLLNAFYSITYRTPRCLVQKKFHHLFIKEKGGARGIGWSSSATEKHFSGKICH